MTRGRRLAIGATSVIVTIGLWHLVTEVLGLVNPLSLPAPRATAERLISLTHTAYLGHTIWGHLLASVKVMFTGWFIAGLVGLPLGVAMAWSGRVNNLVAPTFHLLRSISPIAWIPLAIVWLGVGTNARAFVVFVAAVVPWIVSSFDAVHGVDPLLPRAAKTLGAGRRTITHVVLPCALPGFLAGARIALGNAWTALIAAELLAATSGLGFIALNSSRALDTSTLVAAMAVIGLLGMAFSFALERLAAVLAPWAKTS